MKIVSTSRHLNEREEIALALLDSHVHLAEECYQNDLPQLWQQAVEAGVFACIVPATNSVSWREVLRLSQGYPNLFPALGIQPHDAKEYTPALLNDLESLCAQAAAIGEIGLDFHYDLSPRPQQIECFRAHLDLAKRHNLPVILHCREAEEEFLKSLREVGVPQGGVVHCCTCTYDYVEEFLALGLHIGVTGMVTFPKLSAVHAIAERCPLERLLIETDGPYLAPKPHRGERNVPAFVRFVATEVASRRNINPQELAAQTARNAIELFRLPISLPAHS